MLATPLKRAIRRQVRARLRSSEILWREYLPRRRIERWRLAGHLLLAFMSPLMVAAIVFGLFMAAVLQLGVGLLEKKGPLVGTDNGSLLPLASNSILLSGAILVGVSALRSVLIRSKQLTWCAYYPVADSDFRRGVALVAIALPCDRIYVPRAMRSGGRACAEHAVQTTGFTVD